MCLSPFASLYWKRIVLLIAAGTVAPLFAQVISPRFTTTTQGDIRIAANTLMTCQGGCNAQNGNGNNNDFNMVFVDVDNDSSTFNSSTADLALPSDATIKFAGLYWGARSNDSARNTVRFSTPASGGEANGIEIGRAHV